MKQSPIRKKDVIRHHKIQERFQRNLRQTKLARKAYKGERQTGKQRGGITFYRREPKNPERRKRKRPKKAKSRSGNGSRGKNEASPTGQNKRKGKKPKIKNLVDPERPMMPPDTRGVTDPKEKSNKGGGEFRVRPLQQHRRKKSRTPKAKMEDGASGRHPGGAEEDPRQERGARVRSLVSA